MIFDRTLLFSNAQAITADGPSTDIVDLSATGTVYGAAAPLSRDFAKSSKVPILIQVVETFVGATAMDVIVQTSADAAFTSPKNVIRTTLPALTAGSTANIVAVPPGVDQRFVRIFYDVTGTATAGQVTAGVVAGVQTSGVSF